MEQINGILKVELINSTIMGNTYKVTANINLQIPDYKLVAVNRLNIDKYIYSQINSTVTVPDDIKTLYTCQHCNTNRKRKTYYIFKNEIENNFKVVGSSCCKLHFGIDIENILNKYSKVLTTLDCYVDNTIKDNIRSTVGTVERIVAYDLYNDTKYKSYQSYKEDLFECVTLFNNSYKYDEIVEYYNNNAKEIHSKAIDTMQYILDMENNNEYINNLKDLFSSQIMDKKFIKYVLYSTKLVQIDKDKKKKKETKKPINSNYVGSIGDKIKDVELTVINAIWFDGRYPATMYILKDKQDNIYKWVSSGYKVNLIKDTSIVLKSATIKNHEEYKETKQTVLTRCKFKDYDTYKIINEFNSWNLDDYFDDYENNNDGYITLIVNQYIKAYEVETDNDEKRVCIIHLNKAINKYPELKTNEIENFLNRSDVKEYLK